MTPPARGKRGLEAPDPIGVRVALIARASGSGRPPAPGRSAHVPRSTSPRPGLFVGYGAYGAGAIRAPIGAMAGAE